MPLPGNKPMRRRRLKQPRIKCWITEQPTQTPQSDITPPTWYCTSTAMPLNSRSPTHEAVSEVCFSWGTNPLSKKHLTDPSLMSPPSSKTSWPQLHNQRLESAFTTPKVAPRSESHSPSWATHNPQRLCERITPLHTAS
jgi:hypothetical protein